MSESLPPASQEQQLCVDDLLSGNNVLVEAAAGSGKSTTFYHAAHAWIAQHPGAHIVQLCFNVILRSESQKRVRKLGLQENIDCFTIHALAGRMFGASIQDTLSLHAHLSNPDGKVTPPAEYSLCLLDEAQDLGEELFQVVNRLQHAVGGAMRFMVVGDPRQEIYGYTRERRLDVFSDPGAYLEDNGCEWSKCTLRTSYRMTPSICRFLNTAFRHPSQPEIVAGNTTSADLLPMYVVGSRKEDHMAGIISKLLSKYQPEEVMILSPSVGLGPNRCHALASSLSRTLGIPIYSTHKSRIEVTSDMLKGKLFLSTYHQSKGYERPCVIVLGVDADGWSRERTTHEDGTPITHNSLHVALTRAKEQLVLFQDGCESPYPTIDMTKLGTLATMQILTQPTPKPTRPRSTIMRNIKRPGTWLIRFPSTQQVRSLADIVDVDEPVRLGGPVDAQPTRVANMPNGMAEDVWDYFPLAIISAAEYHLKGESILIHDLKSSIQKPNEQVPGMYLPYFQQMKDNRVPQGAKSWLVLSAMYNTIVKHNYPHELRQLKHFSWIRDSENTYFSRCVSHIVDALRKHPSGAFNQKGCARSTHLKTTIDGEARYCEWDKEGHCTPWQFSFNDVYSEDNLLRAVMQMWTFKSRYVCVFCVPSNRLYRIRAKSDEALKDFTSLLIAKKRGVSS